MTEATSPYLNQPLRTLNQAKADRLEADARDEARRGNYVFAQHLRIAAAGYRGRDEI